MISKVLLIWGLACSFLQCHVQAFSQSLSSSRGPAPVTTTPVGNDGTKTTTSTRTIRNSADYATYWEELLLTEYRQAVQELRERRQTWTRQQLQDSGICVFGAQAVPDSELLGEKIVRITQPGGGSLVRSWRDVFTRGDVLLLTPETLSQRQFGGNKYAKFQDTTPVPKECLVVDVGKDWMTVGVGASWPVGLWESRKFHYEVRLDRTAPQAPLRAQRSALDRVRRNQGGSVANLLAQLFDESS